MLWRPKILIAVVSMLPWLLFLNRRICDGKAEWIYVVPGGLLALFYFLKSLRDFRNDLNFYEKCRALDLDSEIKVTFGTSFGMSGYSRLYLYYPCIFIICSGFFFSVALRLACS